MTKKDLKELLKENLDIVVEQEKQYDGKKLRVTIKFDNEEICSDYVYLKTWND
jgi:hypothetical protein